MPRRTELRPVAPHDVVPALAAALDGDGPAVLPLPDDPVAAARALAALRPDEPLEHDDVVLVVPTSGSTGEPKGVLLTAAALRASAAAAVARLGGPGHWLLALPPTHVGGLQVVVRGLAPGAGLSVLAPGASPAEFAAATAALPSGRTFVSLVPTQLRRLLDAGGAGLPSYDAVLLGGAAAPAPLLRAAADAGVRVVTTYGMSETSGGCVYDGVPLDGVEVSLDDGRVVLRGPVVARGYRLRPDLTRAAFVDGAFRTSDHGTWRDGRLVVLGRLDDVVVTGGEKVAPASVEAALAEHPAVVDVGVVGVPDDEWGQRVRAVVVLRAPLPLAEARAWVAERVSRVAAPRELLAVDALPLLGSGKVDRAALARLEP